MISGRPHPIWRCESCGYWQPRDGRQRVNGSSPDCRYCSAPDEGYRRRRAPLTAAVRVPPASS